MTSFRLFLVSLRYTLRSNRTEESWPSSSGREAPSRRGSVSTRSEEIFLLLTSDECDAYFEALLSALPAGHELSPAEAADAWAKVADAHQEYFRLGDLLTTIVETNVTVERLMDFKRGYYAHVAEMREHLPQVTGIAPEHVEPLLLAVYYHATGLVSSCWSNPLIAEALRRLEIERPETDFRAEMRDFIAMCLEHFAR